MSRNSLATATWFPTFGALPEEDDTLFRVWAPAARDVSVVVYDRNNNEIAHHAMKRSRDGVFEKTIDGAGHGTLYKYQMNGHDPYPDPASRSQPSGVHGPSEVIDWSRFEWRDAGWKGRALDELIIYELHVGTFTPSGTFAGVIERLPYLADLGITAIELMPIAAFAGQRNWGYDGVSLFAPASAYGRPADLQRLVDMAHRDGISVLLDVVYNHLGPDGAYLSAFAPEVFSSRHESPWGAGINLDGPGNEHVRRFLMENALHWLHEYHVDGLRLDATHALVDDSERHFLAELAETVHVAERGRHVHVISEDERNLAAIVRRRNEGGWGLDAVWADDFHHEMHRLVTGESEGYYADYAGNAHELAKTINDGWLYQGQNSSYSGRPRGTSPDGIDRKRFVFCLQNHDQVGNRAIGERLSHLTDLAHCRAAAAVLLFLPETPLLFMGEEWAATTPFLYFTEHNEELGHLVTEGRRREFEKFPAFSDPAKREQIPDPQAPATFEESKLRWAEPVSEPHASTLRLYRALIRLRHRLSVRDDRSRAIARNLDERTIAVTRSDDGMELALVARFGEPGIVRLEGRGWQVVLTTEDSQFAPDCSPPAVVTENGTLSIHFSRDCAVIVERRSE